jgi:hydroxymethylbilane synthase
VVLRIGTRGSALARAQTGAVAKLLTACGIANEVVVISTRGDVEAGPLTKAHGTGVFTAELEQALLDQRIDLAVHSLKDLPTRQPAGLLLAAITARNDARELLVLRPGLDAVNLATLPPGCTVGTSSTRRQAALRYHYPWLEPRPLRGNIDTRLARVAAGDFDAILLACAGVLRLKHELAGRSLAIDELLPAPGQGALALEMRAGDAALQTVASLLDDPTSRAVCSAERALLAALEGGCSLPVGAHAYRTADDEILLRAELFALDGAAAVSGHRRGRERDAVALGQALASELLVNGGAAIRAQIAAAQQ